MGVTNGIPVAPISINDVQRVLGSSSNDLGTLCTSNLINMWSKFKPVPWTTPNTIPALKTDGTKKWDENCADAYKWWLSPDLNYGLDYSNAHVTIAFTYNGINSALTTIAGKIDGNLNGWSYHKPGGKNAITIGGRRDEYYRLLDFIQYDHNATPPVRALTTTDILASNTGDYEVGIEYIESADVALSQRTYLKPDDVISDTLIRGMAIYKKSGSTYTPIAWCTGKQWNGTGINSSDKQDGIITQSSSATCAVSKLKDGETYYALPIYFTCSLAQPGRNESLYVPGSNYIVVTMPGTYFVPFRAEQIARHPTLSGKAISTTGYFDEELRFFTNAEFTSTGWECAIVNENFNGTIQSSPSGSYVGYYSSSISQIFSVGSTHLTDFALTLDMSHQWRLWCIVGGLTYYIQLIRPAQI